jgi:superfamily II DNA or RNA helicase
VKYLDYVAGKTRSPPSFGHEAGPLSPRLFDFQAEIDRWAIRRGRAAIFADCGLGKTLMQLEWARQSGERGLIVAPLAVAEQTIIEGQKIGLSVRKVDRPDAEPGIQITNYEKLQHFVNAPYDAIVLDESGILKSLDGKTRTMLLREFTGIPHRLCCTATPAPNDLSELANHAEFLGVMSRVEMLATFFVHDSDQSGDGGWRLKGHAQDEFWKWVAKWAVYIRKPSDLGFDDAAFTLPPLSIEQDLVRVDWRPEGMLFSAGLGGISDRRDARRATVDARIARCAEIIKASGEQWLVWCGLNAEGDGLEKSLGNDCEQIAGCDKDESKIEKERRWRGGNVQTLITKSKIFGFGMNWQHCHNVMFLGIGDSYEQYYQSMRRCWRFGQKQPVRVVIIVSDAEQTVAENVRRKEADAARLAEGIVMHAKEAMRMEVRGTEKQQETYSPTKTMKLPEWARGSQ